MGYTPIDASFEDNSAMSELDGAQLYDVASRRERPEKVRREEAHEKKEPVKAEPAKQAEMRHVKKDAAPSEKRPPVRRDNAETRALTVRDGSDKPAKKPNIGSIKDITLKDVGRGIRGIMSTKSDVRVKTLKNEQKKPLPVSALIMAAICTLLLMFMIVSYVQINEYTVAVAELRSDLGALGEQDKELSLELERKNDMLLIEQKAGELGMAKVDQLTKKHISLTQEDKIEVIEPEPTADSTVVTTIMSSIWQNFAGLWEYLG